MRQQRSRIPGVRVWELLRHEDERGWLVELFRQDELGDPAMYPVMAYVSMTRPGVARGPHEHREQADLFCFLGPSDFELRLWDNRPDSPTYGQEERWLAGESRPLAVFVPPGVVHGYRNIGSRDGLIINCPNRLYRGWGRQEPVDEIRHELDPQSPIRMAP